MNESILIVVCLFLIVSCVEGQNVCSNYSSTSDQVGWNPSYAVAQVIVAPADTLVSISLDCVSTADVTGNITIQPGNQNLNTSCSIASFPFNFPTSSNQIVLEGLNVSGFQTGQLYTFSFWITSGQTLVYLNDQTSYASYSNGTWRSDRALSYSACFHAFPSISPTPTPTPTRSRIPSLTPSSTPSRTPSPSKSPSVTPYPMPSITPSSTRSPSASPSVSPSVSVTPSPSVSIVTPSPSISPTPSTSGSPTPSSSSTPVPSSSPSLSPFPPPQLMDSYSEVTMQLEGSSASFNQNQFIQDVADILNADPNTFQVRSVSKRASDFTTVLFRIYDTKATSSVDVVNDLQDMVVSNPEVFESYGIYILDIDVDTSHAKANQKDNRLSRGLLGAIVGISFVAFMAICAVAAVVGLQRKRRRRSADSNNNSSEQEMISVESPQRDLEADTPSLSSESTTEEISDFDDTSSGSDDHIFEESSTESASSQSDEETDTESGSSDPNCE